MPVRPALLLAGAAAMMTLVPGFADAAAGPRPPARSKLECAVVYGPGAVGSVRYEAEGRRRTFTAAVAVRAEDDDGEDDDADTDAGSVDNGGVPLFQAGDVLPVTIGSTTPYAVGQIVLAQRDDDLAGGLRLDATSRGRGVRPFPADFPSLIAGTTVTIGAQSCMLQDRLRGRPPRG